FSDGPCFARRPPSAPGRAGPPRRRPPAGRGPGRRARPPPRAATPARAARARRRGGGGPARARGGAGGGWRAPRPRPPAPLRPAPEDDHAAVAAALEAVLYETKRAVIGQDAMLERVLVALLAGGHVLLEGVPGLAKTLTVKTLARVLGGTFRRIQFTPDLVP